MATSVQLPSINGVPIITYGLIGITTLVLAYIAFQDNGSIEKESESSTSEVKKPAYEEREEREERDYDNDFNKPPSRQSFEEDSFSSNTPSEPPTENPNRNPFMGGKYRKSKKSKKSKSKSRKSKKSKTKRRSK